MKEYINIRTGRIISSPFTLYGDEWTEKGKEKKINKTKVNQKVEEESKKEENIKEVSDELTKKDIIRELESQGIKYNSKMTKKELLALLDM